MIKLVAAVYIKLASICLGINSMATGVYLQVIPPTVKKDPLISEAVQLALIQMLGLVGVAFFTNWKANKIKGEVVAVKSEVVAVKEKVVAVETEVGAVKTNIGGVHKEVEDLKVNTDGQHTELMKLNKELSEKIGIEKGIEQSKVAHEEQSEKTKDANIAIGKVAGLEEAKQAGSLPPVKEGEVAKVEIVQPPDSPAPVVVVEKKSKE